MIKRIVKGIDKVKANPNIIRHIPIALISFPKTDLIYPIITLRFVPIIFPLIKENK
jgi:hypothetical protein